jgi:hypothetical protein
MKFKYKFEKIRLKGGWWTSIPTQDDHGLIERHAAEGWRFVQVFAPAIAGYGKPTYFELIFEKPAG